MINRLENIKERYQDVIGEMAKPEVVTDRDRYTQLAKEQRELEPVVKTYEAYQEVLAQISDDEEAANSGDQELAELANEELPDFYRKRDDLLLKLKHLLLPADPDDDRNALLEIRAGTGGDEAGIFAGVFLQG